VAISVFDIFTIGIGPSSSHTVGPMRAARRFLTALEPEVLSRLTRVTVDLFGSLALTGRAHGTDIGLQLGLEGHRPEEIEPDDIAACLAGIRAAGAINLLGCRRIAFDPDRDISFRSADTLPYHSNGMRFTVAGDDASAMVTREYYSVGGGFVVDEEAARGNHLTGDETALPFPIDSGDTFLELGRRHGRTLAAMTMENECCWRNPDEVRKGLLRIRDVMRACIQRGCRTEGRLPGSLNVPRRAPALARDLAQRSPDPDDRLATMDWVDLFAIAVNEENAGGGRVVTAPTNGAAGVVPAVLEYYERFVRGADDEGVVTFLLTAGAVGALYKENASISGAEVGCQGEVGVACSMAAAGLTAVLGGTIEQVEEAAEIGMEHNLGLTCDPVGGLVQIPCIERNAMGAVKAINASRLALRGSGDHRVSLDEVIRTMRETGADMRSKYKESAQGGLAVNVIEC